MIGKIKDKVMTSKKRGLSRGLEALLTDVPVKSDSTNAENQPVDGGVQDLRIALQELMEKYSPSADHAVSNASTAISMNNDLHRERLSLLEEAEALKKLIDDIESVIHGNSL